MEITNGMGATAANDSVSGEAGTSLAFSLRPNGHFITIGLLSGEQVDWQKSRELYKYKLKFFIYATGTIALVSHIGNKHFTNSCD